MSCPRSWQILFIHFDRQKNSKSYELRLSQVSTCMTWLLLFDWSCKIVLSRCEGLKVTCLYKYFWLLIPIMWMTCLDPMYCVFCGGSKSRQLVHVWIKCWDLGSRVAHCNEQHIRGGASEIKMVGLRVFCLKKQSK